MWSIALNVALLILAGHFLVRRMHKKRKKPKKSHRILLAVGVFVFGTLLTDDTLKCPFLLGFILSTPAILLGIFLSDLAEIARRVTAKAGPWLIVVGAILLYLISGIPYFPPSTDLLYLINGIPYFPPSTEVLRFILTTVAMTIAIGGAYLLRTRKPPSPRDTEEHHYIRPE